MGRQLHKTRDLGMGHCGCVKQHAALSPINPPVDMCNLLSFHSYSFLLFGEPFRLYLNFYSLPFNLVVRPA